MARGGEFSRFMDVLAQKKTMLHLTLAMNPCSMLHCTGATEPFS
jgi:hypothetical protein